MLVITQGEEESKTKSPPLPSMYPSVLSYDHRQTPKLLAYPGATIKIHFRSSMLFMLRTSDIYLSLEGHNF